LTEISKSKDQIIYFFIAKSILTLLPTFFKISKLKGLLVIAKYSWHSLLSVLVLIMIVVIPISLTMHIFYATRLEQFETIPGAIFYSVFSFQFNNFINEGIYTQAMIIIAIVLLTTVFIVGPSLFFAILMHYVFKVRLFAKVAGVLPQKTEITYREIVNNIIKKEE
jgi:hypothetical protein